MKAYIRIDIHVSDDSGCTTVLNLVALNDRHGVLSLHIYAGGFSRHNIVLEYKYLVL